MDLASLQLQCDGAISIIDRGGTLSFPSKKERKNRASAVTMKRLRLHNADTDIN